MIYTRTNEISSAVAHKSSYNWQLHESLIDDIFTKTSKDDVISSERNTIESIFSKDKADAYMTQFEAGMASTSGVILIEGGQNAWLERAYRKGWKAKLVFQNGYMEGLVQSAEHSGIMKTIK